MPSSAALSSAQRRGVAGAVDLPVAVDRHMDRFTDRREFVDHRRGTSIEEIERGREPHPKLADAVDFLAFHVSQPKRGDAQRVGVLGDPAQLARSGQAGAIQLVQKSACASMCTSSKRRWAATPAASGKLIE